MAAADSVAAVDSEEALLAFAACMREEGVDFADPVPDEDGNLQFAPPTSADGGGFDEAARDTQQVAREACAEHLQSIELGAGRGNQAEFDADAFLAYAACMRDNGVADFPDPSADGRPDIEAMQALDTTSAAFEAASTTCAEEVGLEGAIGGGRPGGGGRGARG